MTIQDLGALGELIGSVAMLATLVYLRLQTRQNTRAICRNVAASLPPELPDNEGLYK